MAVYSGKSRRGAAQVWILPTATLLAAVAVWWFGGRASTPDAPKTNASSGVALLSVSSPESSPRTNSDKSVDRPKAFAATQVIPVSNPNQPAKPQDSAVRQADTVKEWSSTAESEVKQTLAGDWEGYYQGGRQMTVAADGQGTMVAHPEGLAATLLAPELTFSFRWNLKGKLLEFETVGGEPADKVKVVVQMYGRKRFHKILDLKPDQMTLLDEDGVTKYLWKRAARKSKTATKMP